MPWRTQAGWSTAPAWRCGTEQAAASGLFAECQLTHFVASTKALAAGICSAPSVPAQIEGEPLYPAVTAALKAKLLAHGV